MIIWALQEVYDRRSRALNEHRLRIVQDTLARTEHYARQNTKPSNLYAQWYEVTDVWVIAPLSLERAS